MVTQAFSIYDNVSKTPLANLRWALGSSTSLVSARMLHASCEVLVGMSGH